MRNIFNFRIVGCFYSKIIIFCISFMESIRVIPMYSFISPKNCFSKN